MATLAIDKTYVDGQTPTEEDFDNIKDSVESFVNGTKLGTENIQDSSAITAKIAAEAVTTAKIAADNVTAGKIVDNIVLPGNAGVTGTFEIKTSGPTIEVLSTSGSSLAVKTPSGTAYPVVVAHTQTSDAPVTVIYAVINSNGTVNRGVGVPSCSKTATGVYELTLAQTLSASGVAAIAANVEATFSNNDTYQLYAVNTTTTKIVVTITKNSAAADTKFHLIAFAPLPA